MNLVIILLGIIVVASLGLTGHYIFIKEYSLATVYLGATILYLGLIFNAITRFN